jgi:glutathione-specific gamma-glutamylcyclotransferase
MWIFGYGSLMWDGWQAQFGCKRFVVGDLPGYQRVFNKASVVNWGTKTAPGPTLNLTSSKASCRGIAFEFPDLAGPKIESYLRKREGKGFELRPLKILIDDGREVSAIVPIYEGKNLVKADSLEETAELVMRASGTSGSCRAYIINVATKLKSLGVDDPAVIALARALEVPRLRQQKHR